eukprot:gnl/Chilomastix_caulleri/3164.p2 GENE.gnl/Chilomastix_caulleri/3164~~gnl/Chilomastix_caulleri/3164.p2  ORF type:complete len:69 (-),score=5.83 gnl/Chilomastix_caulleri/3164:205-411(-)
MVKDMVMEMKIEIKSTSIKSNLGKFFRPKYGEVTSRELPGLCSVELLERLPVFGAVGKIAKSVETGGI